MYETDRDQQEKDSRLMAIFFFLIGCGLFAGGLLMFYGFGVRTRTKNGKNSRSPFFMHRWLERESPNA